MNFYGVYIYVYNKNGDLVSKINMLIFEIIIYIYDVFGFLVQVNFQSGDVI